MMGYTANFGGRFMNWIKAFKTMDRRQKARLKRNLKMVFGNIGVQSIIAFIVTYALLKYWIL